MKKDKRDPAWVKRHIKRKFKHEVERRRKRRHLQFAEKMRKETTE